MEISLLTGVHLMITIFDKDDGKIIQYLSDSIEKFQAISQLKEVEVRRRYLKDPVCYLKNKPLDENGNPIKVESNPPVKYIKQQIQSEIYTNDHVSNVLMIIKISTIICSTMGHYRKTWYQHTKCKMRRKTKRKKMGLMRMKQSRLRKRKRRKMAILRKMLVRSRANIIGLKRHLLIRLRILTKEQKIYRNKLNLWGKCLIRKTFKINSQFTQMIHSKDRYQNLRKKFAPTTKNLRKSKCKIRTPNFSFLKSQLIYHYLLSHNLIIQTSIITKKMMKVITAQILDSRSTQSFF